MKRRRSSFTSGSFENPYNEIEFHQINELYEEGLSEEEIANDLNVSKSFVQKLREESEEDY